MRAGSRAPDPDLGGKGRDTRKGVPHGDVKDERNSSRKMSSWGENIPGRRPVESEELGSRPNPTINSLLALRQVCVNEGFGFLRCRMDIMSMLTSHVVSAVTDTECARMLVLVHFQCSPFVN